MGQNSFRFDTLRVLIVNDDEFNRITVERSLRSLNIKSISAALNGFEAFEIIKKNQYDLVLCDL